MTNENNIRREAVGGLQRGTGEALDSYLSRLRNKLEWLGSVCQVHFGWFTHRNVAGCWICDSITAFAVAIQELESLGPYIDEGQKELYGEVPPKDT